MQILKFRSLWGVEKGENLAGWAKSAQSFRASGYNGLEIDIHGLDRTRDLQELRKICEDNELQISVLIFSSWPQYLGPRPKGWGMTKHLERYEEQLRLARTLNPFMVNAHSGADDWDVKTAIEFYRNTLEIDERVGMKGKVCHETHRNRALYAPAPAIAILSEVPRLRITADISHWVVVSERILDANEEDAALLRSLIPKVHHIHARIGTTQSSQCPEPLNPAFSEERRFFEKFWKDIVQFWEGNAARKQWLSFVPEYGPFPYHPINTAKSSEAVADEEGYRLHALFEQWQMEH